MDDFKKLAAEFYGMVLEEHAFLGIAAIANSDDIFDHFMITLWMQAIRLTNS